MHCKELRELKAGLLCYGVNVDARVGKELVKARPYFYDKGFVHAINTNVCGSNVCVSVAENFSARSPYTMEEENGGFYIRYAGGKTPVRLFDDLPPTGTVIDMLARPHSDGVISLWPSLSCCYDRPGSKCKFCSIKPTQAQTVVPAGDVVQGLRALFEKTDKYEMNIGGGTVQNPDVSADYLAEICRGIRTFTQNAISLELAPPSLRKISELKAAGADALIMNLEIASDALRHEICPGKSHISYEHYYDCYREGVRVFGKGNISCVFVVGIQDNDDIVRECEKLTDIGVIPTLIPFKAMDDCAFRDRPNCNPADLLYVSEKLGVLLRRHGLRPEAQKGCTKCGGCSLETNF